MIHDITDTICAISTPPGTGGIAVARISGPQATDIACTVWHGADLRTVKPNTAHVGTVTDTAGEALDQAVATVFRAPRSFTGQDTVEFGIHGSRWVQQELIAALTRAGARPAEPGEFTRRAFANGRMDLAQAEAVADIIASTSRASQRIALSQMRGTFSQKLEFMRQSLLELAALLELELDFSEEDVEFASRDKLITLAAEIRDETARLAAGFAAGQAIRDGIPVAIIGATNAGKSSLLNVLCGDDRAIVSDTHGTTRDVVEDCITVGDYNLRLMDTAGLRETRDEIERMGIERSRRAISQAAIIIAVVDATAPVNDFPLDDIPSDKDVIIIIAVNKSDLDTLRAADMAKIMLAARRDATIVQTSAISPGGTDSLRATLNNAAARIANRGGNDILVTNTRHHRALLDASEAAARACDALHSALPCDLIAQDIRECINHLGTITGAITTPAILSSIFSRYCIGK